MPSTWQQIFIEGSHQLVDCTLKQVIEYMEQQMMFVDAKKFAHKNHKCHYYEESDDQQEERTSNLTIVQEVHVLTSISAMIIT